MLLIADIKDSRRCYVFFVFKCSLKSVAIELGAMIFYAMLVVVLFCLLISSKTDADLFIW